MLPRGSITGWYTKIGSFDCAKYAGYFKFFVKSQGRLQHLASLSEMSINDLTLPLGSLFHPFYLDLANVLHAQVCTIQVDDVIPSTALSGKK